MSKSPAAILLAVAAMAFASCQDTTAGKDAGNIRLAEKSSGGREVVVTSGGREFRVSTENGNPRPTGRLPENVPAPPDAKLTAHITGINEETFTFTSGQPLERIRAFYGGAMQAKGFREVSILEGDGQFSGEWSEKKEMRVKIYAYSEDGSTCVVMIVIRSG